MAITIYTTKICPYCDMAKTLLDRKKAEYRSIDVTNDQIAREKLIKKTNALRTVPQIFIHDQHIGGYDDLNTLNMQGKLDVLLK